ncbi:MAG: hypothetical protein J6V93_04920 [Clostridia bacterium]|nr:hypothetical protein [Clostridia bacterium]
MPYNNGDLGADERDAITADLLLKKLRAGLDKSPQKTEENTKVEAAHISDEAMKQALSEIVYGNLEEYESDKLNGESLSKYVDIIDDDEEVFEEPVDEEIGEADEETLVQDDDPWFDDEQSALSRTAIYEPIEDSDGEDDKKDDDPTDAEPAEISDEEEADIERIIAEFENSGDGPASAFIHNSEDDIIEPEQDDIENSEDAEAVAEVSEDIDNGYLAQMASMIENGEDVYAPDAADGETSDEDESQELDFDELAPITDDGAREYKTINGLPFDTTDMTLLNLFANRNELVEKYGEETASEIQKESDNLQMPIAPKKKSLFEMFDSDLEYTDAEQSEEIKSKYTRAFKGASIRLWLGVIFAALLFAFENAALLGIKLPNLLTVSVYPTVCAMIDLQLVLLCALMYMDKIANGFVKLFKLKPGFESVLSILLAGSVVYTAALTFVPGIRGAIFYNFPVALTFVIALLCEVLDLKREIMSFSVVSAPTKKYAIRRITDEEREGNAQLFDQYVSPDSPMFAVTRVNFADGFFSRIRSRSKKGHLLALMFIVLAEILLAAGLGILMKASAYETLTMAYLALVLGLPGTVIIAGAYPFYRAAKMSYEGESAIIGEGSLDEYSDGSVVFFDEKELFPATGVKINSVKVYGENRIDGVIYYAASIFSKVGGPLADVFGLATVEIGHSENTELLECTDNGVHCNVDGESLYLGSNDYMKSLDFETPYGENDEAMEKNAGLRLMYVANEEEILAKFYVQYTVDREFELIFKQLYKAGMCVGIRTQDPNIDNEFIIRKLGLDADYPVRVVHGKPGMEMPSRLERADSGVVCASTVKPLLRALSLCDRIKYISKIHSIFEIVSTVLVLVVIYAVAALGKLGLGSAYAALYQLFWLIPIMFITVFTE